MLNAPVQFQKGELPTKGAARDEKKISEPIDECRLFCFLFFYKLWRGILCCTLCRPKSRIIKEMRKTRPMSFRMLDSVFSLPQTIILST